MTTKERVIDILTASGFDGASRGDLRKKIKDVTQSSIDQAVQALRREGRVVGHPEYRGVYQISGASSNGAKKPEAKPAPVAASAPPAAAPAASVPKDIVVRVEVSARFGTTREGVEVFFDGNDAPRLVTWERIVALAASTQG